MGKWVENIIDYFVPKSLKKLGVDLLVGLIVAIMLIVVNLISPIAIGFPYVPAATQDEHITNILGYAPMAEEFGFTGILQATLDAFLPAPIAIGIKAIVFSLFHATAYAGSFDLQGLKSASGALIGAGIYGVIIGVVAWWRRSVYTAWEIHFGINWFVASSTGIITIIFA